MSVTTANREPLPTLFEQTAPTSSPTVLHPLPAPIPPAHIDMDEPEDVDMAASLTLPPLGQNHDRQQAVAGVVVDVMEGVQPAANGEGNTPSQEQADHGTSEETAAAGLTSVSAVEIMQEDETGAAPQPQPVPEGIHSSAPANPDGPAQSPSSVPALPAVPDNPAPTPVNGAGDNHESDSDMTSDDDENETAYAWHEIREDKSVPDENEMKEIEGKLEFGALDHEHWEKRTFTELTDPEYRPGPSGRLHWTIEGYNGTKANPNKETVMRSPIVQIGGYDWRIKFFPKGNSSENLSIYIECVSLAEKHGSKDELPASKTKGKPSKSKSKPKQNPKAHGSEQSEVLHTPLPLLDRAPKSKRRSVAAQISVVLYNPAEPRVNVIKTSQHRFCTNVPDWGWTRYCPFLDIQIRHRGQRQALLRNDTLAMTAYIRTIEDTTDCLWEHDDESNPWDSFAITGLQALQFPFYLKWSSAATGNLVSLMAMLILLKPFRRLIYEAEANSNVRPMEMVKALRSSLLDMRMGVTTSRPHDLLKLVEAFRWYGIDQSFEKHDVVELWEIIRSKLEEELQHTPQSGRLVDIFGQRRNRVSESPSYRVRVDKGDTMQQAVEASADFLHPLQDLPQVLHVELKRQEFDEKSRTWKKMFNKISLNDKIVVRGTEYTLFGFITHTFRRGQYHTIVRPNGPGTKWYKYMHGREDPPNVNPENRVVCLTQRQAVSPHEAGSDDNAAEAVAYIAYYVRGDVADDVFNSGSEPAWPFGEEEMAIRKTVTPTPYPPAATPLGNKEGTYKAQVIDSRILLDYEGSGFLDFHGKSADTSKWVYNCDIPISASNREVQKALAAAVPSGVKDPRQIKFWVIDPRLATEARPRLVPTSDAEASPHIYHWPSLPSTIEGIISRSFLKSPEPHRIWVHIVEEADLPPLPEPAKVASDGDKQQNDAGEGPSHRIQSPRPDGSGQPEQPQSPPAPRTDDDTLMSEADDESVDDQATGGTGSGSSAAESRRNSFDERGPAQQSIDTVMSGTQDADLPPAPPPPAPAEFRNNDITPPPPVVLHVHSATSPVPRKPCEDAYFILKVFDHQKQTLKVSGSFVVPRNSRVSHAVQKILKVGKDQTLLLFEELSSSTAKSLGRRKKFYEDTPAIFPGPVEPLIVIAHVDPPDEAATNDLALRCAFGDIPNYLEQRAFIRNFPNFAHGHATLEYFGGEYYSGQIKNGVPHGTGTKIYHNGNKYTGGFHLNQRYGHGLMVFQNGDTYEGEWVANQQHGHGTYTEKETGNTYTGGWKHDKRHGEGVTHWKHAQEAERLCRICWEETANAALNDCGHVVACIGCARRVDNCPVCRKTVLSAIRLYYVS